MSESSTSRPFACDLAVVIGINQYENNIPELRTARYDAQRLANILQKKYVYDVELFTDQQATSENIWKYLKIELLQKIKSYNGKGEKVRLLFYFAGHGTPPQGEDGEGGHLLPQDAEMGKTDNFLSMKAIQDVLTHLGCHHLLVILDCCYAGAFGSSTRHIAAPPEEISKERYDNYIHCPAGQVIASAAHDQTAIDLFKDNRGTGENPDHSPFAELLFKALEEEKADYTKDGITIVRELDLYLGEELLKLTGNPEKRNQPQVCRAWCLPSYDKGEFFFQTGEFNRDDLPDATDLNEHNNPYRGLKAFEEADRRFFFGRREALKELYRRIDAANQPLTVVLGISGSGKSSLVKAGLIPIVRDPELRKEIFNHVEAQQNKQNSSSQTSQTSSENQIQWRILEPIRPGATPFTALARAMLPLALQESALDLELLKQLDELLRKERRKDRDDKVELEELKELFTKWRRTAPEDKLLLIIQHFKCLEDLCRDRKEQPTLQDLQALRKMGLNRSRLVLDNLDELIQQDSDPAKQEPLLNPAEQEQLKGFYEECSQKIQSWSEAWQKDEEGKQFGKQFGEFIVKNCSKDKQIKILLVVDQFEELITQCKQKERQKLLNAFQAALQTCPQQLRLVLTLRDDFQHHFEKSEQLREYWKKEACFRVNSMGRDQLRETIEQPAAAQDLFFEKKEDKSLVTQLLDDIGDTSGALPLLSFTLSELYYKYVKKERGDRTLIWDDYDGQDGLGGVTKALTSKATQEYENLAKDSQTMLRWVMLRMVTLDGGEKAKQRVLESELEYADPETNKRRTEVIDRFRDARLLVTGTNLEGKTYVEPAHDVLVREWDKITTWLSESPEHANGIQKQPDPKPQNKQRFGLSLPSIDWNNKPEKGQERFDLTLQRDLTIAANKWDSARKRNPVEQNGKASDTEESEAKDKNEKAEEAQPKQAVAWLWHNNPRLPLAKEVKLSTTDNWLNKVEAEFVQSSIERKSFNAKRTRYIAIAVMLGLGTGLVFSLIGQRNAQIGEIQALSETSTSQLLSHQELEAVTTSLRTGKALQQSLWQAILPDSELGNQVRRTLQKVLYGVKEHSRLQVDSPIATVAFSPDDQMIATVSLHNGTVQLWNPDGTLSRWPHNGQQVQVTSSTNEQKSVPVVASSADNQIVALDYMGQLVLFNTKDRKIIPISTVAFNPTKNILALAALDRVIFLNLAGDRPLISLEGQRGGIAALAFSKDGRILATANMEMNEKQGKIGTVQIWDVENGTLLNTLEGDMNDVQQAVAISPDGEMVVASGWYGATLWRIDGTWHRKLEGHYAAVNTINFSPDGKMIATGGVDKTVKLWKRDGTLDKTLVGHNDAVWGVNFSPDSQMVASASNDNTVKLWQTADGTLINTFAGHESVVRAVAFSHDGKMIASASDDGMVKLWQLGGSSLKSLSHNDQVYAVAISPDGKTIATTNGHGWLTLWNPDGTLQKTGKYHGGPITAVAFSPNGQMIATAAGDRAVQIRNSDGSPTKYQYLEGHWGEINQREVKGLSFSPDSQTIVTASVDGTVQLFNSSDGKLLRTLDRQDSPVWGVSFSPNGQTIASASADKTVKLWSTDSTLLKTLSGHEAAVVGVAFSTDGQTIASASADKTVKLWSTDGTLLKTLSGHEAAVAGVAFSTDGQTIASASADKTVKLWSTDGTLLKTLSGHEAAVVGVAFSPDGQTIASASADRTVILWSREENLDLDRLLEHSCDWAHDYLQNNPNVSESDRHLCDGIETSQLPEKTQEISTSKTTPIPIPKSPDQQAQVTPIDPKAAKEISELKGH